jgi:hypothetical protein
MCLGFWVGIGWFLLGLKPVVGFDAFTTALISGSIASGSCWIIRVILARLGEDQL